MARVNPTWAGLWRRLAPSWWAVAALGGAATAAGLALAYIPKEAPAQQGLIDVLQTVMWTIAAACGVLAAAMYGAGVYARKADPYARLKLDRKLRFDMPRVGPRAAAMAAGEPIIRIRDVPKAAVPDGWSVNLVRALEWKRFELLCGAYYGHLHFRADACGPAADGGSTALLYFKEIRKPVAMLAIRAWGSRPIGVKPVRELSEAMAGHDVGRGYFHCAGEYTNEAKAFAREHRIQLVTGAELVESIAKLPGAVQKALLDLVASGDYSTPTCPSCGEKMVMCSSDRGDFWACSGYPHCKAILLLAHDTW